MPLFDPRRFGVGATSDRQTAAGDPSSQALSNVQLLRVDDELLDRMVTWDQFAYHDDVKPMTLKDSSESAVKKLLSSGMFSAENLSNSPFAHLPSANIGKLLNRIEAIAVWDRDVIIHEGEEGDYYYLIESGRAQVTRLVGGTNLVLAELKAGDVFGEEALISDSKRNATVTMKSNGVLLRLKKQDFLELMQEPLLRRISYQDAKQKVAQGAIWVDVRHPPEYRYDKLPGAINVPLNDIRNAIGVLSKAATYIAYCQSGRRSHGFNGFTGCGKLEHDMVSFRVLWARQAAPSSFIKASQRLKA